MKAEIINIGDELLIGQVVNTNASWMGEQLSLAGFRAVRFTIVGDDRDDLLGILAESEKRSDVVLLSGGIGPTNDDITKEVLCEYFDTPLVFDPDAYRDIEELFARRGYPVTELNRRQAEMPAACTSLPNPAGTARGMWFERTGPGGKKTVFVSMPGVPFEMKEMMTGQIIPRLKKIFETPFILHRTIMTQGIGESFLAAQIRDWEESLPDGLKLAYLPQPGIVRLRLTGSGLDRADLEKQIRDATDRLLPLIRDHFFGFDGETLEGVVGRLLQECGATLSTAESCTGGAIAAMITSVPGSSAWYKGSVVAYANPVKTRLLGVPEEILGRHGAVSRETVTEMALQARQRFETDYAVATSGVAGPSGGTPEKPVGTAWIAIADPDGVNARHFLFGDDRERNIRRTALQALSLLRKEILKKQIR